MPLDICVVEKDFRRRKKFRNSRRLYMDLRSSIRRPINLILDWDGTLTRKDTLHLVGQIGYQHKERQPPDAPPLPPWSHFGNAYMDDYSAHEKQFHEKPESRTSINQERAWLKSLAPIENRSVRRVEDSGLFRGVKARDVDKTALRYAGSQSDDGEKVQLRAGWDRLCGKVISASKSQVSILSVNWSERFIRQSLIHGAKASTGPESKALASHIETMQIQANEIAGLDATEGSDGGLSKSGGDGIRTSSDKLARLPLHCRTRLDRPDPQGGDQKEVTVIYVGDSATDFEALLAADIGICVRDVPLGSGQIELAKTLERVGVTVVHISKHPNVEGKAVFWARGLEEIADLLPSGNA